MTTTTDTSGRSVFDRSKAFSDFVGFHVRAAFCLTLAYISLSPSIEDFFLQLSLPAIRIEARSQAEMLVQLAGFALFMGYFTWLLVIIFRCIGAYFAEPGGTGAMRVVKVFLVLPLAIALEGAAFVAIAAFVFFQLPNVVVDPASRNSAFRVRVCLLDDFAHSNGLALGQPRREGCRRVVREHRAQLLEAR